MKQKKTMKLWQFIVTECLLVAMLVTMFIPFWGLDVVTMSNQMVNMIDEEAAEKMGLDIESFIENEEVLEEENEDFKKEAEEAGSKLTGMSPLDIMTKSCTNLLLGEIEEGEDTGFEVAGYGTLKVFFWVVYILIIVAMIMTAVGFFAKFTKYIALGINGAVGLLSTIFFVYVRFFMMGGIAKEFGEDFLNGLVGGMSELMEVFKVSNPIEKMLSSCYSMPFTILVLVSAIGFLACSILFMFIGKPASIATPPEEIEVPPVTPPIIEPVNIPVEPVTPVQPVTPVEPVTPVQPAQPSMGQVRVVKGIAAGQGFMLPQDRKIIVGKNPQKANLVIANQHVSSIHCSIRYNAAKNSYIIKDHSSNGSFVNGVRLQKDMAMEYPAGTLLSLADGANEIMLG